MRRGRESASRAVLSRQATCSRRASAGASGGASRVFTRPRGGRAKTTSAVFGRGGTGTKKAPQGGAWIWQKTFALDEQLLVRRAPWLARAAAAGADEVDGGLDA